MENRDQDKLNRNSTNSTSAGDVNRETSQRKSNQDDDSTADFGYNKGRAENTEEPKPRGGSSGSEGMRGDTGRSSSESNLGVLDGDSDETLRDRGANNDRGRSGSSDSEH